MLNFASKEKAFQYLSDITNSRIIIAAKADKKLMQKILGDLYTDELFIQILEADPTVKRVPREIKDNEKIKGSYIIEIANWIQGNVIQENELKQTREILEDLQEFKSKNVPGFVDKLDHLNERAKRVGPKEYQYLMNHIKNTRPRIEDRFSDMDEVEIAKNGKYRAFLIEDHSDFNNEIGSAQWCVRDEEWFCKYEPPFVMFTKGNKFYALLNKEGQLELERMDFSEWWAETDRYYHSDTAEEYLRDNYDPPESDINEKLESEYDEYKESLDEDEEAMDIEDWKYENSSIVDEAIYDLRQEYYPEEEEIEQYVEEEIYPYIDDDDEVFRTIEGTGQGTEFNNASNSSIKSEELKPLIPLLDDIYGDEDPEFLFDLYKEHGFDKEAEEAIDEVKRKIKRNLPVDSKKLFNHPDIKKIQNLFPGYFKELAEKHGQMKMFEDKAAAIQYLSDITGKRIEIKK
jgi:hypothetical protein